MAGSAASSVVRDSGCARSRTRVAMSTSPSPVQRTRILSSWTAAGRRRLGWRFVRIGPSCETISVPVSLWDQALLRKVGSVDLGVLVLSD